MGFWNKGSFVAIATAIFCVLFIVFFYAMKSSMIEKYKEANNESPAIRKYMQNSADKMQVYMTKYGAAAFLPLALFSLIVGYIALLVLKTLLKGKHYVAPLSAIIGIVPTFYFGLNLMFVEERNTAIGNGVIFFTGYPAFYASLLVLLLCAALLSFGDRNSEHHKEHKHGGKHEN